MSDTDGAEQCPFCKQASGCEHLLLLVDRTFRNVEGGALKNIFNDRWYKLLEEGGDDLSERDVFESLLEIVNENADESYEWAFEGGPGMSSDYSFYFVESAESAEKAAQELMKT